LGKALLAKGLDYIGLSDHSLANLVCTGLDRPYFINSELDFNISHSGEYIVCGISSTGKIGVDIEEIKEVPFEDFTDNFTQSEWRNIENGKTKIAGFYDYWTKKEAFLKAIGMGLNVPLNQIEILDNKILWENKEWFLHEVAIDGRYVSHYSTLEAVPKFQLHQLFFE
jgi:4'-phosphopantetheinyl transferase